jgi:hypothetical protein
MIPGAELASETLLKHGPGLLTFCSGAWCLPRSQDLERFERLRPPGMIIYSDINPGQSSQSDPRDVLPVLDHLRSPHAA